MGGSKRKHSSHKDDGKQKKSKRQKKDKRKSKRPRASDSSSSGSDDGAPDFVVDAQNATVAAEYVRAIVRKYPSMKSELRDLLWKIDNEEGVNVDGLPDAKLKGALRGLFTYLNLRHTKQGAYALRSGQDKVLRRIGVVFQERIPDESLKPLRLPGDPTAAPTPAQPSAPQRTASLLPQSPVAGKAEAGADDLNELEDAVVEAKLHVKGPAVPSAGLRRAAAEAAAAMRAEGLFGDILRGVSATLVGPAPAAVVAEADGTAAGARTAEAERVLAVVDKAARIGDGAAPDPYAVLGVDASAAAAAVKKQFWRTSLLVHPDKCAHERAGDAFDAVKKAAQVLQDAAARGAVDAGRAAVDDEELNRKVMAELEQERKWRILQGRATAQDLEGEIKPAGPAVRDGWMTDAPEVATGPPAYMAQKSVSSFAQQGVSKAGVDASWMATPGAKPAHMLTGPSAATVQPVTAKDVIASKNSELLRIAAAEAAEQAGTAQGKAPSLVEQHQEALEKKRKAHKKDKAEQAVAAQPPHKGQAWVPFDRDKDLEALSDKKSKYQSMLDGDSSLGARFHKG